MIRVLTAYALEPDDVDGTVSGVLEQLDLGKNRLKNTAGLLFCYPDFIETGAVKAVCEALPFSIVGCTAQGAATPHMLGEVVLTLMVLTSDEVEFKTGLSEPLENEEQKRIEAFYKGMREPLTAEPPLTFAFLPGIPRSFTGDKMLETLDRLAAGTRFFGSRAIDMDHTPQAPATIYNGGAHPDRLCLMMLAGDVKPRFLTNSIIKQDIFYHKARITGAEGNRLISIDNMPAVKYMEKIGVLENGAIEAIAAFPILADPQDGREPKLLVFTGIDPDGAMICVSNVTAGELPEYRNPHNRDSPGQRRGYYQSSQRGTRAERAFDFLLHQPQYGPGRSPVRNGNRAETAPGFFFTVSFCVFRRRNLPPVHGRQ